MTTPFYKTPEEAAFLNEAQPRRKYTVALDKSVGHSASEEGYDGQVGIFVRSFQEAVVLCMPDGSEQCFMWMDIE